MLVPLLWLLSSSFKDTARIFIYPPQWIPDPWRTENYSKVFEQIPFVRFYWNTILVTGLAVAGQIVSASLVAFGFARLRFPGRDLLFLVLLSTIMIPYHVTLIPTFVLFRLLGWLDTYAPLILPYWLGGGAFYVFLLRQFYMRLPLELDDAARIDGASTFGIYWRVILPQAKPALGVVAVFTFLSHWNDFFNPLIYLNTTEKYTLALGINLFRGYQTTQWNLLMAASVMVTVPCILLYAFAQRYFIQGIVFTGLKG
ncbi:MAG: sugar ABC transporter ATP-binding protein [Chloroflexi bacterium]|nr:MAG: sugar ABC transporter ATP-binding protein [Chloroflexota bacterium]